jgi:hypothetical protein
MFEFIIAGFTGTYLSYFIVFEGGAFCRALSTQSFDDKLIAIENNLDNKLSKISDKIDDSTKEINRLMSEKTTKIKPYNR